MERAQHPGHVAQRRALASPFAQRTRRFTFKIDYGEVFARMQHLAEMQVAVSADARDGKSAPQIFLEARGYELLVGEQTARLRLFGFRQQALARTQQAKDLAREVAHRLIFGALI